MFLLDGLRFALVALICFAWSGWGLSQDSLWATYAKSGTEAFEQRQYKDAVKLLEKAVVEIDRGKVRNASTVEARTTLGQAYRKLSRFGDAVTAHVEACEDARLALPVGDHLALIAAYELSSSYIARGQDDKAFPYLEWLASLLDTDEKARRSLGASPIHDKIAGIHIRAKRYDEAEKSYLAAAGHEGKLQRSKSVAGNRHTKNAELAMLREKFADAAKEYLKAAVNFTAGDSPEFAHNREDVTAMTLAAEAWGKAKDAEAEAKAYEQAEKRLRVTLRFWDNRDSKTSPGSLATWRYTAEFYEKRKLFDRAEQTLKELLEICVAEKGAGSELATQEEMGLGAFYSRRKNPAEAEKWFRSALENRETETGADSPKLADCLTRLAAFLSDNGKHEQAEKLLRRNVANCRSAGQMSLRALAGALNKLAYHLDGRLKGLEAFTQWKEALAIYEKLDGVSSRSVADILDTMAWHAPDNDLRLPLATRAKEIIAMTGERDDRYNQAVNTLGMANSQSAKHAAAEACYRECIALDQDRRPNEPIQPHLWNNIANTYHARSRFAEAEEYYLKAVEGKEKASDRILELAKYQANYTGLLFDWHRPKDAELWARKSFELREKESGKEGRLTARSLSQLAALETRHGSFPTAEGLLDRSHAIREPLIQSQEYEAELANRFEAAWRHQHHGRWKDAEKELVKLSKLADQQELNHIDTSILGFHITSLLFTWGIRGEVAREQGDLTTAESHLRKSLELMEKYYPETHLHAAALVKLARCDAERKEYKAATERVEQAIKYVDKIFGTGHPATADAYQALAELQLRQGQTEAKETLAEVRKMREKDPTAKPNLLWTKALQAQAELQFDKKPLETLKSVETLLKECRDIYGDKHYKQHELLALQAELETQAQKPEAALKTWKQVLAIRVATYGKEHRLTLACQKAIQALEAK